MTETRNTHATYHRGTSPARLPFAVSDDPLQAPLRRFWPRGAPPEVVEACRSVAHPADLAVTLACLAHLPAALEALRTQVTHAARRTDAPTDELTQAILQRLLEPADAPRLRTYDGSSPLGAWLRAIAVRLASNLRRAEKAQPMAVSTVEAPTAGDDPELLLLKLQYRAQFKAAFDAAVGRLTAHERTLLKLHAVEGLSLASIGAMFRRDASTISRALADIRARLEQWTREDLTRNVGANELDSLMRVASSHLSVGLSTLLAGKD